MKQTVDRLLHDADRKVMGAQFARQMADQVTAQRLDRDAVALYRKAMLLDPSQEDPAWQEVGNRDARWLSDRGLAVPC